MTNKHIGSCLCGIVGFEVLGDLHAPDACHCRQCRKQSGHYWAAVDVPRDRLTVRGAENVSWYQSSAKARRGFCRNCGSFLFWDAADRPSMEVAMGAFDGATNTKIGSHIFVDDKGDYYDIADGRPTFGAAPDDGTS